MVARVLSLREGEWGVCCLTGIEFQKFCKTINFEDVSHKGMNVLSSIGAVPLKWLR